jgi:hypothetical protein
VPGFFVPAIRSSNVRFTRVASTDRRNIYTLALEREMLKMTQRRRIYYNAEQRNLMWDRWQKGKLSRNYLAKKDSATGTV